ncbi:hypothetical protein FA10DRAFT_262228 [Acaromyces ingoldii]|uniref:Uncharacterized protein n=1 Tax=Acaromyces ingoldii TaxID=215250 RepID=A0A316YF74_9BASI|nr:hypothetical protein FA10DRAFT_262228 [Acaromyces ingoldii]PWN87761.1 hypothetical protein FA10DRAFT_262228 [Acaromyces ingoldii]
MAVFTTVTVSMNPEFRKGSDMPGVSSVEEPPRSLEEIRKSLLDRRDEVKALLETVVRKTRDAETKYKGAPNIDNWWKLREIKERFAEIAQQIESSLREEHEKALNDLGDKFATKLQIENSQRKEYEKALNDIEDRIASIKITSQNDNRDEAEGSCKKRRQDY